MLLNNLLPLNKLTHRQIIGSMCGVFTSQLTDNGQRKESFRFVYDQAMDSLLVRNDHL